MFFSSCVRGTVVSVACLALTLPIRSFTAREKAWAMLESAAASKSVSERSGGIRALGLLPNDSHARELAEHALSDPRHEVRAAAATALGQMHATQSIPKLREALSDKRTVVVMAAAHALRDLKDTASANEIYYDVLTGERKADGLITKQMDTLRDPKELTKIGAEVGLGYVPFVGIGWDAWRYTHKKNSPPVRAVAASFLAHDPDPEVGEALVRATQDKDWIVRAAAIEAIAQRGDPSLQRKIELSFFDSNANVRYATAAAVIHLGTVAEKQARQKNKSIENASTSHP